MQGYTGAAPIGKRRAMALHRKPPHPLRGPLILLAVLVAVIVALVMIARSPRPVATHPIETDVALPASR